MIDILTEPGINGILITESEAIVPQQKGSKSMFDILIIGIITLVTGLVVGLLIGRRLPTRETLEPFQDQAVLAVLREFTERPWTCIENLRSSAIVVERDGGRTRMVVYGSGLHDVKPGDHIQLVVTTPTPFNSVWCYHMKISEILRAIPADKLVKGTSIESSSMGPGDFQFGGRVTSN